MSAWSSAGGGEITPSFQPSAQLRPLLRLAREGLDLLPLLRLLAHHHLPLGVDGAASVLRLWVEESRAEEGHIHVLHASPRCPEVVISVHAWDVGVVELVSGGGEGPELLGCVVCSTSFPGPVGEFYQRASILGIELDLTPGMWPEEIEEIEHCDALEHLLQRQHQSEEDVLGVAALLPLGESWSPQERLLLDGLIQAHEHWSARAIAHESAETTRERWEALRVGAGVGLEGTLAGELTWFWARARALGSPQERTIDALGERLGVEAHPECSCSSEECAALCGCGRVCPSWVRVLVGELETGLVRRCARPAEGAHLVAVSRELLRGGSGGFSLDSRERLLLRHALLRGVVAHDESGLLSVLEPWVLAWAQERLGEAGVGGWESAGALEQLPGAWEGSQPERQEELACATLTLWRESGGALSLARAAETAGWALVGARTGS